MFVLSLFTFESDKLSFWVLHKNIPIPHVFYFIIQILTIIKKLNITLIQNVHTGARN